MSTKSCFVIMAIGDVEQDGQTITAAELKSRYDDLIKEAVLKARPELEVVRADEVSLPGTITNDILMRIMHSDYVIADVTYPNPNVFYELGLRHACRTGTIIIKDKSAPKVPFDIAHLRYIEYDNTPSGLKSLSNTLATYFQHFERDPSRPDNQLQEIAKLTNYEFPSYSKESAPSPEVEAVMSLIGSPELISLIMRQQAGESIDEREMIPLLLSNPKIVQPFLEGMVKSGELSFTPPPRKTPRKR